MLEKLVIHRFRGIGAGVLEDFNQINLLIGPNNSGKSAVLEMLYLAGVNGRACNFLSENLRSGDLYRQSGKRAATTAEAPAYIAESNDAAPLPITGAVPLAADFLGYTPWSRLWQRHGQPPQWPANDGRLTESNSLLYHVRQLPEKHPLRLFRLVPPETEEVSSYGGFSANDIQTVASFTLLAGDDFPPALLTLPADAPLKWSQTRLTYTWHPLFIHRRQKNEATIAAWGLQGHFPDPEAVLLFDFHTAHDHLTPAFRNWGWHNVPDWYEKIADSLGRVFPDLQGCSVEIAPVGDAPGAAYTGYIRRPGQTPLPVDSYGDGTRHAFKLLTALITLCQKATPDKPALFLWEDPEMFLHPAALQTLLAEVVRLISGQPVQLFMTTHSNELIAGFVQLARQGELAKDALRAFRLGIENGHLASARYHTNNLLSWLQNGMDPRFWGLVTTVLQYRLEEQNG